MQGGIFLLLCVLALVLGSKVRNAKQNGLTAKELKRKLLIKKVMIWLSLVLISALVIVYLPFLIQTINIANDTHFNLESFLSIALFLFALFTIYTIIKGMLKAKTRQ